MQAHFFERKKVSLSIPEISGILYLIVLIILDVVSGIVKAVKNNNLQSSKLREGLWHKTSYLMIIILAYTVQTASKYIDFNIPFEIPTLIVVTSWCIFVEILSIYENICEINPEIGNIFKRKNK